MALAPVGVIRIEPLTDHRTPHPQVFSLASWKQRALNEHLLDEVISKLAVEPTVIKIIHTTISELTVQSPPDSVRTIGNVTNPVTIGKPLRAFPRSKPDVRLSPHPAFQKED